jgi:hypothetical protein
LATVVLIAFFTGRRIEERALAAKALANLPASATPAVEANPPSYRQLAVAEIVGLPFVDFYEALRSAPGEAREKWASELVAMPEGPRRTAAVSGFYKLLVQFDPAAAVKAIREIEDVRLQSLALGAAADAAPGFAMHEMAKLCLNLEDRISSASNRDYLSDVVIEWMLIDAPATTRFIDDHTEAFEDLSRGRRFITTDQVISAWAAVDPTATKEWMDRQAKWDESTEVREAFVDGWYENDRAAAVSYTLAHLEDPAMSSAIGAIVRNLYFDSKEEATKFIQSLPEDKRRDALGDAFHNLLLGDEEKTGDTALTPRAIASWMTEFPSTYWKGLLGRLFGFGGSGGDDMVSWIEQQPPSLRELVAAEYTASFEISPSKAIVRVLRVANPSLRDQLLRTMLKNLHPRFDETKAAVTTSPISSEQKKHLLEIIAAIEAEEDQDKVTE